MKGLTTVIWLGFVTVAGVALFHITFKVEQLEAELAALNAQILEEQRSVHVLRAEWSYLDSPQRLQLLADELLPQLQSMRADQFVRPNELPLTGLEAEPGTTPSGGMQAIPARAHR